MGSRLKILLRLDADGRIGMGHTVRSAALIAALDRPCDLSVMGSGKTLKDFFPSARIVPAWHPPLREESFDLLLIDVANSTTSEVNAARAWWSAPICVIDDFGSVCTADLILNGTPTDAQHLEPRDLPGTRVLAGTRYALIRSCFAAARHQSPAAKGVTLVAGSGLDASRWLFSLLDAPLDWAAWGSVDVVVGAAFRDFEALETSCNKRGLRSHRGCSGEQLATLFANAGIVVLTSGMVLYEALACGAAVVAYPHIEATRRETEWFAQRGCLIDLGPEPTPSEAEAWVKRLRAHPDQQQQLALRGTALVDGRGLERTAVALRALIETQEASASDAIGAAL